MDLFNKKKLKEMEKLCMITEQKLVNKTEELNKLKEEHKQLQDRYNKLKLQTILNK